MPLKEQDRPELLALITASAYKDSQVVKYYGEMTMAMAMNAPTPSLGRMAVLHGEDTIVTGVARMFLATSLYFGEKFSQDMAEVVVRKILAEYELRSCIKLEDVVVICKELVATEQFGKFTANKLLTFIKIYKKRRMEAAVAESLDTVQTSKSYDMNMAERLHRTQMEDSKDKGKIVDRLRTDIKKYYK